MNISLRTICLPVILLANVVLPACGGGGGGTPAVPSGPAAPTYTIGGTASGLAASTSVVLQNNGGDNLTVSAVGAYTFGTALNNGAAYAVTVLAQPAGQFCSVVTGGSGMVSGVNVSTIVVSCVNLPASGKAWGEAASIAGSDQSITSTLRIAADASGNAMAVWEKIRVTNLANDVWYSHYTVGLGWSEPAVIPRLFVDDPASGPTENSRNPDVAMDASGNAIAVWRQPSGSYEGVFYIWSSRYTAGSGWGSRERIGDSGGSNSRDPKVVIDASGNALAVWRSAGIQYNRYTAGIGWASPAIYTGIGGPLTTSSHAPVLLATNASGDAMAVWSQDGDITPTTRYDIWSSRYTANAWSEPELIETDDAGSAEYPQIAMDASGNALAVWQQLDGQNKFNVLANRYTVGTGWGTAALISGYASINEGALYTQIAMDASGNAMTMWRQDFYDPSTGYLDTYSYFFFNRYTVGTGWGTPAIMGSNATTPTPPVPDAITGAITRTGGASSIAINASGDTVATWAATTQYLDEEGSYSNDLKSSRYTVGTGWSTPESINTNTYEGIGTSNAFIDSNGNALAVWVGYSSIANIIWFNRFD